MPFFFSDTARTEIYTLSHTTLFRSLFAIPNTVQVGAIEVNGEIWITEQTGDRITRRDITGTVLGTIGPRSEEHTSELQSLRHLVCRLLLEKKKKKYRKCYTHNRQEG